MMGELLSDETIAELRAGLKGLPSGPWEIDRERQDDAPEKHYEFALFDAKGRRLCGTENCDFAFGEIETEYDENGATAWNEPGRRLMEYIASCDPTTVGALLDAFKAEREARKKAEAERDEMVGQHVAQVVQWGQLQRDLEARAERAEAALSKAREDALREAAEVARGLGHPVGASDGNTRTLGTSEDAARAILSLIPAAPAPAAPVDRAEGGE